MSDAEKLQRFRVVADNTAKPKKPKKPANRLSCPTCLRDTGVSGITTLEVKIGVMERKGRPTGGTRQLVCVECLARGKITCLL